MFYIHLKEFYNLSSILDYLILDVQIETFLSLSALKKNFKIAQKTPSYSLCL